MTTHGNLTGENQIENLSNLIHGLVLPQNQEQRSSFKYLEEVSLKLQRIVFQTVDWMVKHHFCKEESFQDFYRQSDIIQLAAINLARTFNLKYKQTGFYPAFPRIEYILGDNYSSHFKSIPTGELISQSTYLNIHLLTAFQLCQYTPFAK